jgi:hypothetical protein
MLYRTRGCGRLVQASNQASRKLHGVICLLSRPLGSLSLSLRIHLGEQCGHCRRTHRHSHQLLPVAAAAHAHQLVVAELREVALQRQLRARQELLPAPHVQACERHPCGPPPRRRVSGQTRLEAGFSTVECRYGMLFNCLWHRHVASGVV